MERKILLLIAFYTVISASAQFSLKAPNVKWDESYTFDKCNVFKIEAYAKNNELMRTIDVRTYYQSGGENFSMSNTSTAEEEAIWRPSWTRRMW